MIVIFKHLDKSVQPFGHLMTAVVFNNKRHLELGMLLKLIKLPRMEICYKIAIMLKNTANHPMIGKFRQVMQGQPPVESLKPESASHHPS